MAYKTATLKKQAIKIAQEKEIYFLSDVIAKLPCSRQTFYDHKLDEFDKLEEILTQNKVDMKVKLRKKWGDSDNATLNIALYRLLCNDDERRKIAMKYNEHTGRDGESLFGNITDEKAKEIAESLKGSSK